MGGKERSLKAGLEKLYRLFDRSFISPDPLECVPTRGRKKDIELSAFIASVFAYGRADLIVKNVHYILAELGPKPLDTLLAGGYSGRFNRFRYRFHKRADLLWLLDRLSGIYTEYGSLENAFAKNGTDQTERLKGFSTLFSNGKQLKSARAFLVPSPANGSACKRMNLFLRWMVRKDDVDLGLWKKIKPCELIIPLDVHLNRIAARLGLVRAGTANFIRAMELTDNLRLLNPDDPVRYDFAICTLGKLGHCAKNAVREKCVRCVLKNYCADSAL